MKFSGLQPQAEHHWLRERESVLTEHSSTNGENAGSSAASVQGHQRPQQRTRVEAAEAATSSKPKAVGSARARSRRQPGPPQTRPSAPIKWKASKPKRFGIKKALQKMRAAARVGARLRRWLSRARTSLREAALARARAPPSLEIVATPPPSPQPTFSRRYACRRSGHDRAQASWRTRRAFSAQGCCRCGVVTHGGSRALIKKPVTAAQVTSPSGAALCVVCMGACMAQRVIP